MKTRYNALRYQYNTLKKNNFKEFISRCTLFLSTLNKVILREKKSHKRKQYRALFQEVAVFLAQTEYKFLKKKENRYN